MKMVLAHRGASGEAPENTLEAFDLAVKQGAHGVELDVHISRDGQIIVAHDETIDRVSNGSGRIADMTLGELKRYNYNKTRPACKTGTLPTLEEVFALLKPTGMHINVELKNSVIDYPDLEKKCIGLAARMGMTDRVLYSSFNHYSLLRVKAVDPAIRCGMLYGTVLIAPWTYAKTHGMDALHPHFPALAVDADLVKKSHELGVLVNPWTVNEEADIRGMFEAGADYVITNYPGRARKVLADMA